MTTSPEYQPGLGYAAPLQPLLSLGEDRAYDASEWPDYPAQFGLDRGHVADLIRMACDSALNGADSTSTEVWAPMHAWRALGQMRAGEAVLPLLAFVEEADDDETADVELPVVFGMIGQPAFAPLVAFLEDRSHTEFAASTALFGIKEIAERHPACRAECIGALTRMLEPGAGRDPMLAGFAVSALIDLKAVETIDAIRDAFRRDAVDISVSGDVEDAEIALGVRKARSTPAPRYAALPIGSTRRPGAEGVPSPAGMPLRSVKVGRNDPCPCGSGKKYKKCCLP